MSGRARDAGVAVVGVGTSASFGFRLGKSPIALQTEAFAAALHDAEMDKSVVDGIVTSHGTPGGVDYEEFVLAAGLRTRWASQKWSHGRWAATTVIEAALAIAAGLADVVAVVDTTTSPRGYRRELRALGGAGAVEGLRDMGGGHGESTSHGIDTPGAATALVARQYMDRYGASSEDLARVAMAFRAHAQRNSQAIMYGKPMDRQQYEAEPMIAAPFRRADYCLSSEGSVALLLTSSERAGEFRHGGVPIVGWSGLHTSRDDYVLFARAGLSAGIQTEHPLAGHETSEIYRSFGCTPREVDGLYVYDSFSSNLWMVLERFGFCGEGEAPGFVADVGIGPGGRLPVNTNGGLMSEAHLSGYAHLVEMVRQLRGTAGERQLPQANLLQWATPRGDGLLLAKAAA